jgi:hypothetical protein
MKSNVLGKVFKFGAALSMVALVGCGGGGGGGGSSTGGGGSTGGGTSTYGTYSSPSITVQAFIDNISSVDGEIDDSFMVLDTDETYRSFEAGEDEWFVMYDAKYDEYKAVSLQYIRAVTYYDYYQSNYSTAEEFRNVETDDILSGDVNGDFWGDDYEVVDYDGFSDSYWGRNSGFEYEDEEETTDVALMAAEKEQIQFIKKASEVSYTYSVSIETSMSLVSLSKKMEKMVSKGAGELTLEDQLALAGDVEKLTGASIADLVAAATDESAKADLVKKISKKIGTSADNLENRLLPDLLGIQL